MYKRKGFTLIELLIVITILSILAVVGSANYITSLKRARDSKKIGDIEIIKGALINYYANNSSYPATTGTGNAATDSLITSLTSTTLGGPYLGNNFGNFGTKNNISFASGAGGPTGCGSGTSTSFCFWFTLEQPDANTNSACTTTPNSCTNCNTYCVNDYGRSGR